MRRIDSAGVAMEPLWQATGVPSPQPVASLADTTVRQVEEELAVAKEAGYRDGYAHGLKQARDQVERDSQAWQSAREKELDELGRQLETTRVRLAALVESISGEIGKQAAMAEETAVGVAYAAVVKLLGDRYQGGEVIRAVVCDAMSRAGHTIELLRVAESDVELLEGLDSTTVIGDARLSPGQCVLETLCGHYETGLDVRLDSLKTALLSGLARYRVADGNE